MANKFATVMSGLFGRKNQQPEPTVPDDLTPIRKKAKTTGLTQIQNLSNNVDLSKVQNALRQAEQGDTRALFGYYRDFFLTNGAVAGGLSKRKLAVLSEPFSILPNDKNKADDVMAAKAVEEMINRCPSWNEGIVHILNGIIYPLSVAEKIYRPVDETDGENPLGIRFYLKELAPVDYNIISYRIAYMPVATRPFGGNNTVLNNNDPKDIIYNPDDWEPDLRFWNTFDNGMIDQSPWSMYAPDPTRHFIYRCNLLTGIARDNFGGLGRSVLFWSIMSQLGRDKFLQLLNRFGVPYITAKVDTADKDTLNFLADAFDTSRIINALVINKEAELEINEINMAGTAEGHEKFLQLCNDQIDLLILGQTLSSNAKSTGLGSGVANLQSQVRQDIRKYDQIVLGNALRTQLFTYFLRINGFKGVAPKIVWGGADSSEAEGLSNTLLNLYKANIEPTTESLELLEQRFGFSIQKIGGNMDTQDNADTVTNKLPLSDQGSSSDNKESNAKP